MRTTMKLALLALFCVALCMGSYGLGYHNAERDILAPVKRFFALGSEDPPGCIVYGPHDYGSDPTAPGCPKNLPK